MILVPLIIDFLMLILADSIHGFVISMGLSWSLEHSLSWFLPWAYSFHGSSLASAYPALGSHGLIPALCQCHSHGLTSALWQRHSIAHGLG